MRRAGSYDAFGTARQDERRRTARFDLRPRRVVGDDFRIDMLFAYATRDQLAILRTKVDDDDGLLRGRSVGGCIRYGRGLHTSIIPTAVKRPGANRDPWRGRASSQYIRETHCIARHHDFSRDAV